MTPLSLEYVPFILVIAFNFFHVCMFLTQILNPYIFINTHMYIHRIGIRTMFLLLIQIIYIYNYCTKLTCLEGVVVSAVFRLALLNIGGGESRGEYIDGTTISLSASDCIE